MRLIQFVTPLLASMPSYSAFLPRAVDWTKLPPIKDGPRQEQSVVAVGTDLYIIGGIPQQLPYPTLNKVEVFSTVTKSWRDAAPLPCTLNHGNAAVVDGKIYILGGLNGTSNWAAVGNGYEYDPRNNTWAHLPFMPNRTARGASAVGVRGSTIYIAGGLLDLNLITNAQPSCATVSSYDTKTKEWTKLPSLPEGRDHVGGAIIGDVFYVVGGRVDGVQNVRDTVFAMDVSSPEKRWIEKATMPTARGGLSTAVVGSRIYTFGGEGSRNVTENGVYSNVEVYDTVTDMWEILSPMPFPRHGTNAATIGCSIYIPGGGNVTEASAQASNFVYRTSGCTS